MESGSKLTIPFVENCDDDNLWYPQLPYIGANVLYMYMKKL